MAARLTTRLSPLLRETARRTPSAAASLARPIPAAAAAARSFHVVPAQQDKPGSYSRTDKGIEVEYPEDQDLPTSEPVAGAGGQYVKPTLQSFTLNGNVGIVTGGARGLGLVIAQGMVFSGSDVALVDMNSTSSLQYSLIDDLSSFRSLQLLISWIRGRGRATDYSIGRSF